jgi:TonB family protein
MPPTDYPLESVAANEEGTLIVDLAIAADGSITDVSMQQSSGYPRLDAVGVAAMRKVRLSTPPMTRDGVPTAAHALAEIVWNLPLKSPDEYFPNLEGGAPLDADDVVAPAEPVGRHMITLDDYPPASIRAKDQGRISIYSLIDVDGRVREARVAASSGIKRLDDAALRAARKFRYQPAQINGMPAATWWPLRIFFLLQPGPGLENCDGMPGITRYERRNRAGSDESIPTYNRWNLINAQGKIEDSLLLTEKGWMRLDPALLAVMNAKANYQGIRPTGCWVYDGVNPMMKG